MPVQAAPAVRGRIRGRDAAWDAAALGRRFDQGAKPATPATKKAPGERGPCEKLEVEQLLAIEGVDYATDGQHNHENRRCCHDAHAHASLLTMAIMSPQMIQTPPKINVSALGS